MPKRSLAGAVLAVMLLSFPLFAAELVNVSGGDKVALEGHDPVAFFTESRPVKGLPSIRASHRGATYHFASEQHRALFEKNPEAYAPQYGGFCAYGVAFDGLYPVQISTWQVRDGKLYLNKNADILKLFNADFAGSVAKADRNWPGLVEKKGR